MRENKKPYIIAEAGTNHNGNPETAMKLVKMAKDTGADSVKFQIIYPEGLYIPYFYENSSYKENPVIEQRKKFMLKDCEYEKIADYAKELAIDFSASVFDEKSLDLLLKCNPPYIKIASCDLNNISFLRKVAEKAGVKGIYIILSTGLSILSEIKNSVSEIKRTGFEDIVLMHCVSVYPAKTEEMNLSFIDILKENFDFPIGFSDHTNNSISAAIALSKGAVYFEKHITLDRSQEGFDHAYAAEKNDFKEYITDIKSSYKALQKEQIKLKESELNVKKRARRALYAKRDLKAGDIIKEGDVLIVRPEAYMKADEIDLLTGKECKRDIMKYEPFSHNLIK